MGATSRALVVFPFFVGYPRSGTTLFRAIFDSHPYITIPGESHFIVQMALSRRYNLDGFFPTETFLSDLLSQYRFKQWNIPDSVIKDGFAVSPPRSYPDAIRLVYALYAQRSGKPRYGDKTPAYVLHIRLLASLFPEAKFVHIIRDGRDVALSHLDVEFGSDSLEKVALAWRRSVTRGRRAGRELGPRRYQEVRYEDLLDGPEEVVRRLCAFLDLRFDSAMLRYFERAHRVVAPVRRPDAHRHLYLPPTKGLRDWRQQMTPADVAVYETLAGDLLDELGYERAPRGRAARSLIIARSRQLTIEARRLGHGARKRLRKKSRSRRQEAVHDGLG